MGMTLMTAPATSDDKFQITVCSTGIKTLSRYREASKGKYVADAETSELLATRSRDELLTLAALAICEYEKRENQL